MANVWRVARREYLERAASRAFLLSTLLLAGLAMMVALIPVAIRVVDRATVTRVVVASAEAGLAEQAVGTMDTFLNGQATSADGVKTFIFEVAPSEAEAVRLVSEGRVSGAVIVERKPDEGIDMRLVTIGGMGQDRQQLLQVGAFAVGILDWTASQPAATRPFVIPTFTVEDAGQASGGGGGGGGGGGQATVDPAEYGSRRIVGIVFVVLEFLTLVFYGMWVASGVVAEKASRVMELLISAATAPQLVTGKIVGIGLAGLTQVGLVLVPSLMVLAASGGIATAVLGPGQGAGTTLTSLSPGLVLGFLAFFVLGFALYASLYAGAGSLLSRAEDLQIVALPLSIPAIMGYLPAVLALSGGSGTFIRIASFVPFWSPFVMLARMSVGTATAGEVALSLLILLVTVPIVAALAIRVYRAGVLVYGQPPTLRTYWRAVRGR
jgi:ABC-2 type transport system permease protein